MTFLSPGDTNQFISPELVNNGYQQALVPQQSFLSQPTAVPGEGNSYSVSIPVSLLFRHLKMHLWCSDTRFAFKRPERSLLVFATGSEEQVIPLTNISEVTVTSKFRIILFIFSLLFIPLSISFALSIPVFGLFILAYNVYVLFNCTRVSLKIRTNAGTSIHLSFPSRHKQELIVFNEQLQSRLFADHSRLQHEEHLELQYAQLQAQRLMLEQMAMQNKAGQLPASGTQPGAHQDEQSTVAADRALSTPPAPPPPPLTPPPLVPNVTITLPTPPARFITA